MAKETDGTYDWVMDSEMMVCLFAYVIKGPLDKGASRSESAEMLEGRGKVKEERSCHQPTACWFWRAPEPGNAVDVWAFCTGKCLSFICHKFAFLTALEVSPLFNCNYTTQHTYTLTHAQDLFIWCLLEFCFHAYLFTMFVTGACGG